MERTGRHYRNHLAFLLVLAVMMLIPACSVKEDRDACPCVLELDLAVPDSVDAGSVEIMLTSSDGWSLSDTVDVFASGNRYSAPVPRTDLHVRAWAGTGGMASEYGLQIPLGKSCPRVYMHDSDVHAEGETVHETAVLRKNHCVMTLMTEGGLRLPSEMILRGNVAGYDEKGQPLAGNFELMLEDKRADAVYEAVLPRQTDSSLMLEIDEGKDGCKAFALGHYIVSSGYDWNAPDLDDITIVLDYALTEIRIVINGWESVYRYEVEI